MISVSKLNKLYNKKEDSIMVEDPSSTGENGHCIDGDSGIHFYERRAREEKARLKKRRTC